MNGTSRRKTELAGATVAVGSLNPRQFSRIYFSIRLTSSLDRGLFACQCYESESRSAFAFFRRAQRGRPARRAAEGNAAAVAPWLREQSSL